MPQAGRIHRISGSTVIAEGIPCARMYDLVRVGRLGLMGEIIRIAPKGVTIQVYEDTSGLAVGEPVECAGEPLSVELGPGLLGSVFDGVQRPLAALLAQEGDFILRGTSVSPLDRVREWPFTAAVSPGDTVGSGSVLGSVPEGGAIVHRVLVPPGVSGTVMRVFPGPLRIDDPAAVLADSAGREVTLTLASRWPVRVPRPALEKLNPRRPFLTGQRILDTLFPIARGGSAIVPGGFGTGKTVLEQTLAKFADADVIIYVGCGERGNEMTEVQEEFPRLVDPRSGRPLMERTILVVNTSNMPMAAREASIYTGITRAEYYRDMGYHVALMADSTSRWAEALREISSRLEEMPGEEGYPTYMASRLAGFYERAGLVRLPGPPVGPAGGPAAGDEPRTGSVTVVSAVSPPGGDFSEPVTQASMKASGALWALDTSLAHRRHYPAISWTRSYSLFLDALDPWFRREGDPEWHLLRAGINTLLAREKEVSEVVQLVGEDAIPDGERVLLRAARLVRETYLRQNAYHPEDGSCPPGKQAAMMRAFLSAHRLLLGGLEKEVPLDVLLAVPQLEDLARLNEQPSAAFPACAEEIVASLSREIEAGAGKVVEDRKRFAGKGKEMTDEPA
jgi:V/A-type H+/Na+-transporting ATPase subunit A